MINISDETILEIVQCHWDLDNPEIGERFNEESARLMFKIKNLIWRGVF
ncbi:hypothetical protein SAMN04487770_11451 [Butyrivibrio sp. ob235]|nr:hypothetical protein [Butyrivibrio sp. ob235]SEL64990.1 hypothetical protein SAMN04487770_11451 [Butyrivibrio sp. ob235]